MRVGSFIGLLDTWVGILQELNATVYTRIMVSPHGGRVNRIGELKKAGLIISRRGTPGGHKLTLPFEDIPLSSLLSLRTVPDCPTIRLLNRYAEVRLAEILSWPSAPVPGWLASLDAITGVLSLLSHTAYIPHKDVHCEGISDGYVLQILYHATRAGLVLPVAPGSRQGGRLSKPFTEITVQDIYPLLSQRYQVYSSLIGHTGQVKLCTLLSHEVFE